MINADTRVHSLYGSPVGHSLSPVIFNTTFEKLSMNRAYVPFEVSRDKLKDAVGAARTLGFDGFNVTMPHKTTILEMLDRLDKSAEESRSVNTVARAQRGLVGYSTDGEGAVRALRSYGFEPRNKRVVVIGAGGAAQALVQRFSTEANEIMILNRTVERARGLAEKATGPGGISYDKLTKNSLESSLPSTDLLVNTTPIQTLTLSSQLKIPINKLKDASWVMDLAYDRPAEPVPTRLGSISPLEMLIHQAALSYEIWFKETAPFGLMRSSLVGYLGKDWK
jgi:shikimate dehydrogenase